MHRVIDSVIWHDDWFTRLTPPARYLFLYLVTNEHTHISGLYLVPKSTICEECGMTPKKVNALLKLLKYRVSVESIAKDRYPIKEISRQDDPPIDLVVIWVHNMLRHQGKGSKVHSGAARQLATVASTKIARRFLKKYPGIKAYLKHDDLDTLSGGSSRQGPKALANIAEGNPEKSKFSKNTLSKNATSGNLAKKADTLSADTLYDDSAPLDDKPYQAPPDTLSKKALSAKAKTTTDRDVIDVIDTSQKDANNILKSSREREKHLSGIVEGKEGDARGRKGQLTTITTLVLNDYERKIEAYWSKIKPRQIQLWKESHPSLDINLQLRKFKAYLYSIQEEREYERFGAGFFNWLNLTENPPQWMRDRIGDTDTPSIEEQIGEFGE